MIPKVIHRLWIGGPEPEWTRPFAKTWVRPGWLVKHWGAEQVEEELLPLENQWLYENAAEFTRPELVQQLRSDIIRYEILHRCGGVWVDADMECVKPINKLLDDCEAFLAWEVPNQWINNAVFGAAPEHPFVGRLIERLRGNAEASKGYKPNKISGPQFLTRVFLDEFQTDDDIRIYPARTFYPYSWQDVEHVDRGIIDDFLAMDTHGEVYAVHHWANKRRETNHPYNPA